VERVDYISAARGLFTPEERLEAGYQPGEVKLVTNLGVFEMDPGVRELALVSIHPGHTVEEVQAATGIPLQRSPNLAQTPCPTREELSLIRREVDPLGMRRLEFVAGKERGPLLAALIDSEEAAIAELAGSTKGDLDAAG
jgi:glutaconate CoA-transferase, subunit A